MADAVNTGDVIDTITPKQTATPPTNDPMQKLKQASADDFNAWKAAQLKVQEAEATPSDSVDIESLRKVEAEAKEKSTASKAAMKEARAKEKEVMQAKKATEDPTKQLKMDAAITRTKAKKALKALESLGEDHASYDALKTAYEKAQTAAENAELALKAAEEA